MPCHRQSRRSRNASGGGYILLFRKLLCLCTAGKRQTCGTGSLCFSPQHCGGMDMYSHTVSRGVFLYSIFNPDVPSHIKMSIATVFSPAHSC